MDQEQRDALYGKSTPFSEHKEGDVVTFREDGQVKTGTILHVRAPGPAIVDGQDHPVIYVVDTGHGLPSMVAPSQVQGDSLTPLTIVHRENSVRPRPFFALLATYGFPDSALKNKEEAENLAANVVGEVITGSLQGETRALRVIKARVDVLGEGRGNVVGECEVVEEES